MRKFNLFRIVWVLVLTLLITIMILLHYSCASTSGNIGKKYSKEHGYKGIQTKNFPK